MEVWMPRDAMVASSSEIDVVDEEVHDLDLEEMPRLLLLSRTVFLPPPPPFSHPSHRAWGGRSTPPPAAAADSPLLRGLFF